MALHEQSVGATDEWYTPPHVFEALDCKFDMDVASPGKQITPWIPAKAFITKDMDGLSADWKGFIWMNAPFGKRNGLVPWLQRFAEHGSGICLVPDRTSAPWWQHFTQYFGTVLFVSPKIRFISADGKPGASPAQGTCLMGSGSKASEILFNAAVSGLGRVFTRAA